MLLTISLFIVAYFLGSLMPGLWLGKFVYHRDIRDSGSGNIGTTNAFRVLGVVPGIIVLLLDILKGTLAACLPLLCHADVNGMLVGVAAILGHTFSLWIRFKGGKAVATSAGVLLGYNPQFFGVIIAVFVVVLLISSMVSLSAMATFTFASLAACFYYHDPILLGVALVLTVFVFYRHRTNISRIVHGTENLVPFGWYYRQKNAR